MRARPFWLLATLTGVLALSTSLLVSETLLRITGHPPWRRVAPPEHEAVLFEADAVRGWRSKPGHHVFVPRPGESREVRFTILPDGSRATGPEPPRDRSAPLWALVGDSFGQGWGLSDEETLAWRLQARWPGVRLRNDATGGYGTYQSLLTLEERFAADDRPEAAVYAFTQVQEERNVATARWLRSLAITSRSGMAAVPHVTLDPEGRLVRHPPLRYPEWPLREVLATVTFLQDLVATRQGAARAAQARDATERLILELQDLCLRHGSRFIVLLLDFTPADRHHHLAFLRRHRIESVDCALPIPLSRRIPRDGHPNAAHQRAWEQCVVGALGSVP